MMYVDLNPIRAGINNMLEDSDFTSIQGRFFAFAEKKGPKNAINPGEDKESGSLLAFKGGESLVDDALKGLPFSLLDYFELIDWTGRAIRDDKKGAIPLNIASILQKLGVAEGEWVDNVSHFLVGDFTRS